MDGQGKYRRISQKQKEAIYFMACVGKTPSEIGLYYGIDMNRVHKIVREMDALQTKAPRHEIRR